jgi:hypothetical protein
VATRPQGGRSAAHDGALNLGVMGRAVVRQTITVRIVRGANLLRTVDREEQSMKKKRSLDAKDLASLNDAELGNVNGGSGIPVPFPNGIPNGIPWNPYPFPIPKPIPVPVPFPNGIPVPFP